MKDINLLLTDEFVQFSDAIKALHQEKKALKEEFKKVYEDFQTKFKSVDVRASKLAEEFQKGKEVEVSEEVVVSKTDKKK